MFLEDYIYLYLCLVHRAFCLDSIVVLCVCVCVWGGGGGASLNLIIREIVIMINYYLI